jgi:hypothetical protein
MDAPLKDGPSGRMQGPATTLLLLTHDVRPSDLREPVALARESLARSRAGLRRVTCGCEDGALVLRGRVHSFFLKQLASICVSQAVPGGVPIVNQVDVA